MKMMSILGIFGLAIAEKTSQVFLNDQVVATEVDKHSMELSQKPKDENPIYLDAIKNNLLPNKILTTFKSPNFVGSAPPGITTFMAFQVFLSGERKGGFVYPLFLKNAIEDFGGKKKKNITVEDECTRRTGKPCPPGYVSVTTNTVTTTTNPPEGAAEDKKPAQTTTTSAKLTEE